MAPADSDERMAPPSLPTPASVSQNQFQSTQETIEKYRKLKRRYAELEEESNTDSNRSGDRNVRMREEKDYLREKLREMETNGSISPSTSPILSSAFYTASSIQASSSTLPRTLLDPKARTSFENNLREAMDEGDADDDLDPLLTSRHLGPLAKKRGEEERNGSIEGDGSGTRKTGHTRGPSGGAQVGNSPRLRGQNPADRRSAEENGDVEMEDGHGPGYSYSRHSSNGTRRDRQERDDHGSENTNASSPQSSRRETRSSRATRGTRNDGTAIAAVAAAAAEAEAAAVTAAAQSPPPGQPPINGQQSSRADASNGTHLANNSSSTLANALGLAASTQGSPSRELGTVSTPPSQGYHIRSPSMESILKVAEAAVAAQNAAAATKAAASSAIQSNTNVDPNLDPSLSSPSKNGGISSASSASSNKPPSVNTAVANATASTSTSETPTATPTSSLSNNPYLSLSTNLLPRTSPGSTTPTGHPMLIPYPMYYPPPPSTPGTPNSPQYPMPYNPYYYLTTPMVPGANGIYPAPVQFPPAAPAQQQRSAPEPQRPKAKRLKAHTVTTRSFSIPMVPRDKKNKPMLPLNVGIMTVISLGDVCMREHFHTERYIFPVGYEVTRRYLSTVDPTVEVVYHCTILDGGDGPKFQIIPSDRPDKPIIAGTATGAWSNIVKQANAIRNRQHSNSVSGPDFFGLGQNTIKHLIQELPNADRLRDYVWQNFIEGGPLGGRHAAVIPALPEEYDASMPIGAYYPKRDTTSDPNVPRGLSHYPQHIIAQAEAQKAQKLAAQRMQGQPIAGPSGSNAPSSSSQQSASPSQNPQPGQPPMLVSLGGPASELNIHEYQPPQPHPQAQSVSQGPERRTTRSTAASTSSAPPKTSTSTSAHHTRSASRGNARQPPPQTSSAPPPVPPSLNADGTMPTTFADIMNAYPAPGVQAAPVSNPTGTSGS